MAQILVRGLDENTVEQLKRRARQRGRSLQSEVRTILEQVALADMAAARQLAARIRSQFQDRVFDDSAELIRQDRDR